MKYLIWFFQTTAAFLIAIFWLNPRSTFRRYSNHLWMGPDRFDEQMRSLVERDAKARFIQGRKARGRGRR